MQPVQTQLIKSCFCSQFFCIQNGSTFIGVLLALLFFCLIGMGFLKLEVNFLLLSSKKDSGYACTGFCKLRAV
jgi:hypothetical protein